MRAHKTTKTDDRRPVLYRHAKCKNCDYRFTYHIAAAPNKRATRPECPECDTQGLDGPFGRTNPAEWLPIVQQAGEATQFTYADWLAGDASLVNRTDDGYDSLYVFVGEKREYLPCRITEHRRSDGVQSTGFGPETWAKWLSGSADISLVERADVPDCSHTDSHQESDDLDDGGAT